MLNENLYQQSSFITPGRHSFRAERYGKKIEKSPNIRRDFPQSHFSKLFLVWKCYFYFKTQNFSLKNCLKKFKQTTVNSLKLYFKVNVMSTVVSTI